MHRLPLSAVGPVRAGLGLAHLAFPGLGGRALGAFGGRARALGAFGGRARAVVRVLGARQVVQGLASSVGPTGTVLALGAEVDAAHLASMVALGLASRRWRRAACVESLVAAGLAWAGLVAARAVGEGPVAGAGVGAGAAGAGAGAGAGAAGAGAGAGAAGAGVGAGAGGLWRGMWALRDRLAASLGGWLVPRCLFWGASAEPPGGQHA